MRRFEIAKRIGNGFLTENTENGEWSYPQAFKDAGLNFDEYKTRYRRGAKSLTAQNLDMRFVDKANRVSVLVETKKDIRAEYESGKDQLEAYVGYERQITGYKVVAILASTDNDDIAVWRGAPTDSNFIEKEKAIKTMEEYVDLYLPQVNDKEKVMANTYALNELLHKHSIPERIRSQFVGTCLLTLKAGRIDYRLPGLEASDVIARMRKCLGKMLDGSLDKAEKLSLLDTRVLQDQAVQSLNIAAWREILSLIEQGILPFINSKSTAGQDLLNLFFTTFNKYVGKADKNQAFTPDHITDFMAKVAGVSKTARVLDPCCGSGSFLVRAMVMELDDCLNTEEEEEVKKSHIYGIEYSDNVFGLATTNMLIHGDGNSNIRRASCFDLGKWIEDDVKPDVVLMNPPYNCQRSSMDPEYVAKWGSGVKEDPSKGLHFVKWLCDRIIAGGKRGAKLAVLLPVACAIGTSAEIKSKKEEILKENHLDAVFTMPAELFYPGASASACCMLFTVGVPHTHEANRDTFFGYYKDDGFKKKKNLGRVEQVDANGNSRWIAIEREWIDLYKNGMAKSGLSAVKRVSAEDEWLAEAYMETDYSDLGQSDFQRELNDYLAYLTREGRITDTNKKQPISLESDNWKAHRIDSFLNPVSVKKRSSIPEEEGNTPFVSSSSMNNGVSAKVADCDVVNGPCITVSTNGACLDCFYHDGSIAVSTDVDVFTSDHLNAKNAMFICTVLHREQFKWSYGRKPKRGKVGEIEIRLPTAEDGTPDWQAMEDYISSLPYGNRLS